MIRGLIGFTGPVVGGLSLLFLCPAAFAQRPDVHPGSLVYQAACASCHEGGDERAPALTSLQAMSRGELDFALTEGVMAVQGGELSAEERLRIIDYLAGSVAPPTAWLDTVRCAPDLRRVDLDGRVIMGTLGVELTGSRRLSAEAAGLATADLERLELAWAFGFPEVSRLRAAPVIVGSTLFYSAMNTGKVLALDVETGCVKWIYDSPAPLRSSLSLGTVGTEGPSALFFGDGRGRVHAVDALTGVAIWVSSGRADPESGSISGSVVVHESRVIVPISDSGVSEGSNPEFECCVGRGAVTALDVETGEQLWTYFTMEPAAYTGELSPAGVRLRGPSGAPIWSTPTIDVRRGRVYVTTGENTSLPATGTSDAVIALDLETGEELWVFQGTPNDVWNMACGRSNGPNCPDAERSIRRDWDFGGSAILAELPGGRELLLAGQKSGHLWALEPEDGSVVWQRRMGTGGALGGNHWGIAIDGERVLLPISDPGTGDDRVPGMYAFDIATGTPLWEHRLSPDCSVERTTHVPQCDRRYGLSATPLVVDGAVVSAGTDGRIHIFDTTDGAVLFQFDTARPFETINGVEGHGGGIDAHSIAAGAGMVFIGSGYSSFSQPPGNVLLAFRPRPD